MTVTQTAVEASLRLFCKVLWNKKPERLFHSLVYEESSQIKVITQDQLNDMTKLARRSWKTRVLRYASILPEELFTLNPVSQIFKTVLKAWIQNMIPQDGDLIFKGRVETQKQNDDWLEKELQAWKQREVNKIESQKELQELEESFTFHC